VIGLWSRRWSRSVLLSRLSLVAPFGAPCRSLLLLALALFGVPRPAIAASAPELICDPDAKITFQSHWRGGSVELAAESKWDLPWTGNESLTPGTQLKTIAPAELSVVPDEASFRTFRNAGSALYVEQPLYLGQADDGLVIASTQTEPGAQVRVFHCRGR
jgi:hypothetical protein